VLKVTTAVVSGRVLARFWCGILLASKSALSPWYSSLRVPAGEEDP
jgi:hypothetical protein